MSVGDTCSPSFIVGEEHVSFPMLTVVLSAACALPQGASVQMWAGPPGTDGYGTRPSVLRCVQLY